MTENRPGAHNTQSPSATARAVAEYRPASQDLHSDSLLMPGTLLKPASFGAIFCRGNAVDLKTSRQSSPAMFSAVVLEPGASAAPPDSGMPCFPRAQTAPQCGPVVWRNRPCSHDVHSAWFRLAVYLPGG